MISIKCKKCHFFGKKGRSNWTCAWCIQGIQGTHQKIYFCKQISWKLKEVLKINRICQTDRWVFQEEEHLLQEHKCIQQLCFFRPKSQNKNQKPKCKGEVKMKLKVEVPIMDVWYFMIRIWYIEIIRICRREQTLVPKKDSGQKERQASLNHISTVNRQRSSTFE